MLAAALEEEVNAFLGRHCYERGKAFRGYRNGYHSSREITVGLGPVEVQVPRVAKIPSDIAPQGIPVSNSEALSASFSGYPEAVQPALPGRVGNRRF